MTFESFFRERTRTQPLYSSERVLRGSAVWEIRRMLAKNKGQQQNRRPSIFVERPDNELLLESVQPYRLFYHAVCIAVCLVLRVRY